MKSCFSCKNTKANLVCGTCQNAICKFCSVFLEDDAFSFMTNTSEDLHHKQYCNYCFMKIVRPVQQEYADIMKRAKLIILLDKPSQRPLPIEKCGKTCLNVENCSDEAETALRLAFQAAEQGYNALIKVNIRYQKVRNYGYQKMVWRGTGFPAILNIGQFAARSDKA